MLVLLSFGLSAQISLPFECGTIEDESGTPNELPVNCAPFSNYANGFEARHGDKLIPSGATIKTILKTNIIIMQDDNGEGNFKYSNNAIHKAFLDEIYERVNQRMVALSPDCTPAGSPNGYTSLNIEFEPNFIEIQDSYLYNHRNDPQNTSSEGGWDSQAKPYLNAIVTLAESHPDYQTGFNVILTTDKFFDDNWDRSGEIWQSAAWGQGGSAWYYGPVWYSARSVFDNTITPKFHAPDFFLNYQQQIASNGGSSTWISDGRREETIEYFSGLIIHEYGHYFNLGHTTICSNNYMSRGGFNISQNYSQFSADQIRELYKSLMFRNLGEVVKCIDRADAPFIIDADETWSADTRIFRDIIVESGSKLEITCTLHMQPGSRIFVKRGAELHVNGGTITGCGEYWNGIRVEGYSDFTAQLQSAAGLVRIDNGAIIENAKNIVSMWNGHISWPQVQEYYGGLVIADNATFRDSWRAVEFMRYASNGHLDKSTFTNCTFEDLRIGVSNWESDGVTFDNCTFNRISKMCILPYNSEVDINIQVGSTIKNPQGGGQLNNEPADNRFVHSSSFGWNAIDNYQFNGELEYVSRTLDQNSEFRPRNSINVVVSLGASFELFDACNDLNPFTGSTPDSLVLAYCATDEGLTGGLGGAVLPPGSAQDCRRERELTYAKQLTHSGMIDAAAQHLLSSLEFDTRIFGFGVYLTAARITDARTSLATLSPVSQEEQDFVWTQDL